MTTTRTAPLADPTRHRPLDGPQGRAAAANPSSNPSSNRPFTLGAADRDRLVRQHSRMVRAIAWRIHARLPESIDLDDLVQEGMIGLLEAIDRHDPARGVPLDLYARQRVTGAILDLLRRLDWIPRSVRDRAEHIALARDDLRDRLGRTPRREELAAAVGVPVHRWDRFLRLAEIQRLVSLDAPVGPGATTPLVEMVEGAADTHGGAEADARLAAVVAAVERLPPREREAVQGFYLEERPLHEVAGALGVTASRASQLHRAGVRRLRHKVREHLAA